MSRNWIPAAVVFLSSILFYFISFYFLIVVYLSQFWNRKADNLTVNEIQRDTASKETKALHSPAVDNTRGSNHWSTESVADALATRPLKQYPSLEIEMWRQVGLDRK